MEQTLKQYGWLANLALITICAWLAAGLVASLITQRFGEIGAPPPLALGPPAPTTLAEIPNGKEAILQRNLFNRRNPLEDEAPLEPWAESGAPAVKSDLKFTLLGTVVTPDPEKSIATVQLEKASKRYHVKDPLDGKHEIRAISRGRVEFVNKDTRRLEFLAFPQRDISKTLPRPRGEKVAPAGISQTSDSDFVIDAAEWEAALANLNQIITQARAVPNIIDGKTDGFRIFAIRPGSIYQKLGVQNGDVLTNVNGLQIDTINKALTVFETLKSEKNFEIQLKRGGQGRTFKYEIR